MRFEVLGPLTALTDDGTPVSVPEAKVRALLAALLVHHGRPVPVDRLIEDLWGDALPGNPANTLQTKVSQLRRALEKAEPGARALVAYGPAGYRLRAADEAVDAGRFGALTTRARETADPRTRASLLAQALNLWQGDAFGGFRDAEFTQAAIAHLEEQRLTAQEEAAELRLELGEHHVLADELTTLVAHHPLRERLRAAHMRALYRAGRQSEALDAYRDLSQRLAADLGIDPSAELDALHQAILRHDPALTPPAPAPTPGPAPTPAPENGHGHSDRPRGNLPSQVSELIGREDATVRICGLVAAGRLVTLSGPGGVGKTRLALAAATRLAATGGYPDGVWFVELAAARGAVAETIAAAIGVRDSTPPTDTPSTDTPPGDSAEHLAEALAPRQTLLVLDNCEHVIDDAAALVERLLRRAPDLRILTTSQEPLALCGEVLEAVAPLHETDAMRLFATRAAATAPGFALDVQNTEAVALICRRLDGIPLAIELAATRVRALGVHALADRLHDRFRLLNQVRRDAPARQRTLRAMIDWSWQLLSPPEQTVLRRLAVFRGGFTLEAAESVCATSDVLDVVTRLVDLSLVAASHTTEGARYAILESVTAYGLERLADAGELADTRHRHARHYTDLAEQAAPRLHGPDQHRWLRRLDSETPNLRAALDHTAADHTTTDHTATDHAADLALRQVNALTWYWYLRGRIGEARRSLDLALDHTEALPAATASARARRAALALLTGDGSRTGEEFDGADARARWLLAFARCGFDGQADPEGLDALLDEFRTQGDRWGAAAVLSIRATQAVYRGDLPALRQGATDSAALFAELGDRWGQLRASEQLGILAEIAGDYPEAARLHHDGLQSAEELQLWIEASFRLARIGRIALLTGDDTRADEYHRRAARLAAEQSHAPAQQFAETGLALGARRRGELDTAESLLRPWLDWNRRLGVASGTALVLAQLGYVAEQRGDPEAAEALHREALVTARGTGDPRAVALALEGLAGASALADRPADAAELLGAAHALRTSVGSPLPPGERADVHRAETRAREALGGDAYATAHARGQQTPNRHLT
ncbi:BTAD domain-containing putative transcriptional regulator [Streptomyces sp. O3]